MSEQLPLLPHFSLNESKQSTLLLIHGGFSSRAEFGFVIPHLSNYHLLIPALPRHNPALSIGPVSLPYCSKLLAHLIREKAKDSKAHVAGLSFGGHLAIHLAARHPDLVGIVFASGINDFKHLSKPFLWVLPYLFNANMYILPSLPTALVAYMLGQHPPAALQEDMLAHRNLNFAQEMVATAASDQDFLPVQARTLIVAAAGSGKWWDRNFDLISDARKVAKKIRIGDVDTRAVAVKGMAHAWNLQAPELYAEAIDA